MKNREVWKKNDSLGKTSLISSVIGRGKLDVKNGFLMINFLKTSVLFLLSWVAFIPVIQAQYEDNPLRGKRWVSVGGGLNTSDYWSWQAMFSYSKRGEGSLVQARVAFTQELWIAENDSCTERRNKLSELGVLWGDGWGGRSWYVTGAVGFGFNVRQYCRKADYKDEYITGLTLGVPFQIEAGLRFGKYSGISVIGVGNWNFREPYAGAHLAYTRQLSK